MTRLVERWWHMETRPPDDMIWWKWIVGDISGSSSYFSASSAAFRVPALTEASATTYSGTPSPMLSRAAATMATATRPASRATSISSESLIILISDTWREMSTRVHEW